MNAKKAADAVDRGEDYARWFRIISGNSADIGDTDMNAKKAESTQEKKVKQSRDKAAKFKELATKRTNKALRAIEGIASLSNRNSYTYDDAQVAKIFSALESTVAAAKKAFESKGAATGFTL